MAASGDAKWAKMLKAVFGKPKKFRAIEEDTFRCTGCLKYRTGHETVTLTGYACCAKCWDIAREHER